MRARSLFRVRYLAPLGLLSLGGWLLVHPRAGAVPPAPQGVEVGAELMTDAGASGALDAGVDEDPTTATIVFITVPNVSATVTWGRKLLGKIAPGKPLVVVRPRDSGPLDVMVRAPGYLAVQTRAHTFSNSRVLVKLTPPDKKSELLGYRIPIEAGVDGGDAEVLTPEAGVSFAWDGGVGAPVVPVPVTPAPVAPAPATPAPLMP